MRKYGEFLRKNEKKVKDFDRKMIQFENILKCFEIIKKVSFNMEHLRFHKGSSSVCGLGENQKLVEPFLLSKNKFPHFNLRYRLSFYHCLH